MTAPANQLMIQGVTVASADYLNTMMQWVPSAAVARTFIGLSGSSIFLLGTVTPNDGGQGLFYWDPLVSTPDDGLNVIRPPAMITGGWVRSGPSVFTGFPPTYLPPGSTTPAVCQTNYVAQGAATLQLQPTTTAGGACTIFAFAYGGNLTLALLSSLDNINGGPTGGSITIPKGYSSTITNDGAGHYFATITPSAGGPQTVFLSGGTTVASPFVDYVALATSTLQLPPSSTLNTNWSLSVFGYGGSVVITPLSGTDVINGQSPGASLTCPLGYYFRMTTDAAGHFYATVQPASVIGPNFGSAAGCFSAYLTATQSLAAPPTISIIQYDTALYNIGGFYNTATYTWTPPAGRISLYAQIGIQAFGGGVGADNSFYIMKNGSIFKEADVVLNNASQFYTIQIAVQDQAVGTDRYQVAIEPCISQAIGGPGSNTSEYFMGSMI
jgi:hypothetical protein